MTVHEITKDTFISAMPFEIEDGEEFLFEPPTAAALWVLTTVKNTGWWKFIDFPRIDWTGMLSWARALGRPTDSSRLRIELAASLAGLEGAAPSLYNVALRLDADNRATVFEAVQMLAGGGLR
jgi:hypothetical protein